VTTLQGAGFTQTNVTYAAGAGNLCLVVQQTPSNTPADPTQTTVQLTVAGDQATCQPTTPAQ
jgi:hypothetical protein